MKTDAAFVIGTRHSAVAQPCQDYATSGDGWVAVSDGCSTGGRTDIGARMWAIAAENVLTLSGSNILADKIKFAQLVKAEATQLLHPFHHDDGLATLVVGAIVNNNVTALVQGDGAVAVALSNGGLEYWEVSSPSNAPLYPQYTLSPPDLEAWKVMVKHEGVVARCFRYDDSGVLVSMHSVPYTCEDSHIIEFTWAQSDILAMVICTDGVFTMRNKSPFDAFSELLAVNDPSGKFMQRRLAAMGRQWRKDPASGCEDDLAVGGVWLWPAV